MMNRVQERAIERPLLPEGYCFIERAELDPHQLNDLYRSVGWVSTLSRTAHEIAGIRSDGLQNILVGVGEVEGRLVGFGNIVYGGQSGQLNSFAVDRHHRSQGIGRAIIDERLRLAQEAGITSLYIPYFEDTNTLTSYYQEKGFAALSSGGLGLGPRPLSTWYMPSETKS